MKKTKILLSTFFVSLILLLSNEKGIAQDSVWLQKVYAASGCYTSAYIDDFNNVFGLTCNNQFKKLSHRIDSAIVFNDVRKFGKVFSFDATNPLRILLFYKQFSTALILDRFLSPRTVIDLRKCGIFSPLATCCSYDNNVWVFDDGEGQLKKVSMEGEVLFSSTDLRLVFPMGLKPQYLFDSNGLLYLCDSLRGIFVFDYYGAFNKKIDITGWQSIQIQDGDIAYIKHGDYFLQNKMGTVTTGIKMPASIHGVSLVNKFVSLNQDSLTVYTINKY